MKKSYEEICSVLDEKMKILENDNTSLTDLVDAYKDGIKLINEARILLDNASKEIEEISNQLNEESGN